ncbi:hypothetical protein ACOACO_17445 [Nocardioides sp. CPCC 205120]|uniref:hypothetical protein n=1 Tax=Nocardioides sp. CPCC 205120 TaxID=3406462 RepID=UPI003B5107B1
MSAPQIVVTVTGALARRGTETPTGTAFLVYAGATGPTEPVRCYSSAEAVAAEVPAPIAAYVDDVLRLGAPSVYVVRAAAADAAAVTQPEWATALATLSGGFGVGQVLIPGVATAAAHGALLAHAAATGRTVLLDAAKDAAAASLATTAAGLAAAEGADRAGLIAPWVEMPGPAGTTREVPGSVVAAGLAARGDAAVGHANHAPAGDQGRGAGTVTAGRAVTVAYTGAERDTLHDAGVSVIRLIGGVPTLYGWVALSDDATWRQLSAGRMAMQLQSGLTGVAGKFLFRQLDGRGLLYRELEGALRGYLAPIAATDALWGPVADAFDVDVEGVNTPTTAAAGELHAAVAVALTPHTERVVINVVTSIAEGA